MEINVYPLELAGDFPGNYRYRELPEYTLVFHHEQKFDVLDALYIAKES